MTVIDANEVIVEGQTEPVDVQLKTQPAGGELTNLVGTGLDVAIEIQRYEDGVLTDVDTPPTVAWLSQAGGTVRVSGIETLEVGSYAVRFTLTNIANDVGYVPNGPTADLWRVVAVGALR
jgi:hypothetical protein